MEHPQTLTALIPEDLAGLRLDQALARLYPDFSRARIQAWIRDGDVTLEGVATRPRERVSAGARVEVRPSFPEDPRWEAQELPLALVHEDGDLLVVDKPAGVVVHPGAGNPAGTLVNALLAHAPELARLPRAGIVHRIDKDTSGLLVVARSPRAHKALVEQLREHRVERVYAAVAQGVMTGGGTVDAPIARHPVRRTEMAVVATGKPAVTHYRVAERFRAHTHVRVTLETGRTHQVRVHLAHIRHPLAGDPVYGGRLRLPPACPPELAAFLRGFRRQALHAARLTLAHPADGRERAWESPLPADLAELLALLRADRDTPAQAGP